MGKPTGHIISEELLRMFFEASPVAYFLIDKKGNFLYGNKATEELSGYNMEELIGVNFLKLQLLPRKEIPKAIKNIIRISMSNKSDPVEFMLNRKDGSNILAEVQSHPVTIDGKTMILGIARDITKRKKAEEQNRKFNKIIETTTQSVVVTNIKGTVQYVNQSYYAFSGFSENEVIGKSMYTFANKKGAVKLAAKVVPALLTKGHWRGEMSVIRKDKSFVDVELICSLLSNERKIPENFVAIFSDITERKTAEQKLQSQNLEYASLNAEYEKQNELLIEAVKKAEESDRLKSSFLANMSHEIRTPMNGILGFSELLKEPDLTSEEQANYIKVIEQSGERMLHTINDIVDMSKLEAGQMEASLSEVSIKEVFEFNYHFFKKEATNKGLEFSYTNLLPESKSIIKTDREKLHGILTNLIRNAIKFTQKGSVEFGCQSKDRSIEFFVRDTGIGIPEDQQKIIFDRFVQADLSKSRQFEGTGLGLSITKAYVDLLGGKIWVESEAGKGSTFYITIPASNKSILNNLH